MKRILWVLAFLLCLIFLGGVMRSDAGQTPASQPTRGDPQVLVGQSLEPLVLQSTATSNPAVPDDSILAPWLKKMLSWRNWNLKFHNKVARNGRDKIVERRVRPEEPNGLSLFCVLQPPDQYIPGLLGEACVLLRELAADEAAFQHQLKKIEYVEKEVEPLHSSFLERVHADGLWTQSQLGGQVRGLFGAHMTITGLGRLQVYGPPGVMVITVPTATGGRERRVAYTWGVSYALFTFPVGGQRAMVHLNLTKAWIYGGKSMQAARNGADLAGLSITWKKTLPKN